MWSLNGFIMSPVIRFFEYSNKMKLQVPSHNFRANGKVWYFTCPSIVWWYSITVSENSGLNGKGASKSSLLKNGDPWVMEIDNNSFREGECWQYFHGTQTTYLMGVNIIHSFDVMGLNVVMFGKQVVDWFSFMDQSLSQGWGAFIVPRIRVARLCEWGGRQQGVTGWKFNSH